MPATIEPAKREKLFNQVRHMLGAPIRGVELEDEMLDTAIELAILDYGQYVQDWLIENQWSSLYGQDLDVISLTSAFLTRDLSLSVLKLDTGITASSPYNSRAASISASRLPASESISGQDVRCRPRKRSHSKSYLSGSTCVIPNK